MTTSTARSRLVILLAVLLSGLSVTYLLPTVQNAQPSGVELALPPQIGNWHGKDEEVTEKEHSVLGPETEFARKSYQNKLGDVIYVSVVLSGPDMNTSIHRPERCLPAQGWTIVDSRQVSVPLEDADWHVLRTTRLHNMRPVRDDSGRQFNLYNLYYYWFVGFSDTTPSHFTRTYYDIRDRILTGCNQRWAYVTVGAILNQSGRSEPEMDRLIKEFIRQLVPIIHKPSVKYG